MRFPKSPSSGGDPSLSSMSSPSIQTRDTPPSFTRAKWCHSGHVQCWLRLRLRHLSDARHVKVDLAVVPRAVRTEPPTGWGICVERETLLGEILLLPITNRDLVPASSVVQSLGIFDVHSPYVIESQPAPLTAAPPARGGDRRRPEKQPGCPVYPVIRGALEVPIVDRFDQAIQLHYRNRSRH